MQLVKPAIERRWITSEPLKTIESAGRTCYRSETKITEHSAEEFVRRLIKRRHFAMLEHASASYKVVCDRGVTHEIVRHRLFSYAQESTRYCNYKGGVTFVIPCWLDFPPTTAGHEAYLDAENQYQGWISPLVGGELCWMQHMLACEETYIIMAASGWTPQQARSVLPNSLKTEIVITGNLREWRHFFHLRCAKAAHPQMQEVANMLLEDIKKDVSVIFEGLVNGN